MGVFLIFFKEKFEEMTKCAFLQVQRKNLDNSLQQIRPFQDFLSLRQAFRLDPNKAPPLQIPVIQDLPVGHNLQDHIAMGGLIFLIDHAISMVQPRYENLGSSIQYAVFGGGL